MKVAGSARHHRPQELVYMSILNLLNVAALLL
jgi:hypothetical protein